MGHPPPMVEVKITSPFRFSRVTESFVDFYLATYSESDMREISRMLGRGGLWCIPREGIRSEGRTFSNRL